METTEDPTVLEAAREAARTFGRDADRALSYCWEGASRAASAWEPGRGSRKGFLKLCARNRAYTGLNAERRHREAPSGLLLCRAAAPTPAHEEGLSAEGLSAASNGEISPGLARLIIETFAESGGAGKGPVECGCSRTAAARALRKWQSHPRRHQQGKEVV